MREERVPKSKEEERPLEYGAAQMGADRVSVTGRCQIFMGQPQPSDSVIVPSR